MDETKILELFGKQVLAIRRARGWSQEKLALAANLDRTYVSSVEKGRRNISLINIYKFAKALDVPPSSLLQPEGVQGEQNR